MPTHNPEFIVVKKSYTYVPCHECDQTGKIIRRFRQMEFVKDCSTCKGEGRLKHSVSEEVPLIEALKELSIIK